eukprot:NODE_1711_length_1077_cov_390.617417.p1 GENE.NODE_1711_length_1077_cov_390.617417~~NODE_1711_length_1077_cov_390.617417.p1  ORF type:complete len:182 (+),score=31.04 NODE_1711_length_1077_cov_390.617417:3-548(+)
MGATPVAPSGPVLAASARTRTPGHSPHEVPPLRVQKPEHGAVPHDTKSDACQKLTCHFKVGIEDEANFRVVRRLIGAGGKNMKFITSEASKAGEGAMVWIRGQGAQPGREDFGEALAIQVSAVGRKSFERASTLVGDLLSAVQEEYRSFCRANGCTVPPMCVRRECHHHRGAAAAGARHHR